MPKEERANNLRVDILRSWQDNEALRRRLAQQRAGAIKDYLVTQTGLAPERVYLIDARDERSAKGTVSTQLHLDAM
jgi:hypothetical protein